MAGGCGAKKDKKPASTSPCAEVFEKIKEQCKPKYAKQLRVLQRITKKGKKAFVEECKRETDEAKVTECLLLLGCKAVSNCLRAAYRNRPSGMIRSEHSASSL